MFFIVLNYLVILLIIIVVAVWICLEHFHKEEPDEENTLQGSVRDLSTSQRVVTKQSIRKLVRKLTTSSFRTVKIKTFDKCAICKATYEATDDVVELRCDNRHKFH